MTVFQFTASIGRLHIRDQQPSEPIPTKFGSIRRRHHLQDAADDAGDGVQVGRVQLPTLSF